MLLGSKLTATVTALSLVMGAAAPAHALGRNERNFLKGIAAAVIVGTIINESQKSRRAPAPDPQPVYRQPRYDDRHDDRRAPHRQTNQEPVYRAPTYQAPQPKVGRIIGSTSTYGSGVMDTTAARVFNSYSRSERLEIQRKLTTFGFYRGSIDGAFGPRTHQAIYEFARTAGKQDALNSASGAYQVYDALLG